MSIPRSCWLWISPKPKNWSTWPRLAACGSRRPPAALLGECAQAMWKAVRENRSREPWPEPSGCSRPWPTAAAGDWRCASAILVMGATSAIAEATARGSRAAPTRCFSSDANAGRLQAIADDLKLRGAVTVGTQVHDARDVPGYGPCCGDAGARRPGHGPDPACHPVGSGDLSAVGAADARRVQHQRAERDSTVHAAGQLEVPGHGIIAVISSVAGGSRTPIELCVRFGQSRGQRLHQRSPSAAAQQGRAGAHHQAGDAPMTTAFKKGALWASPPTVAAASRARSAAATSCTHRVLMADHDDHPRDSGAHFRQAQTVIPPRRWGDL